MAFQGSLVPPMAENEGKGNGSVKLGETGGAGEQGNPTLLADSVSLDEQKAKGDMKKKGRLDPYAYIPLNRTKLNRRYAFVLGLEAGGRELSTPWKGGPRSH